MRFPVVLEAFGQSRAHIQKCSQCCRLNRSRSPRSIVRITHFIPPFNRAAFTPHLYRALYLYRTPSFCHLRLTVPSLRYPAFISLVHISVRMVWWRNIPPAEHAVLSSPAAPPLVPALESRSPGALSPLLQVRTAGTLRRQ